MIVTFHHGWGFDASLWQRVLPLLADLDCRADDRGYFAEPREVPRGAVAVCHSFGTLRALAAPPSRAIVAINGFDCFTARGDFPGVPARLTQRMAARFASAPEAVLSDFRARCAAPPPPPIRDEECLRADLAALGESDLRRAVTLPVEALHAADDPIVPSAMQAALFARAPALAATTLAAGGHLLPLTAPEACAKAIRRAVEALA
ncbi:alpha/beta hydrolase [Novosphingobium flavum]|uniref:Alpha/beta hydrolase n=1 Tax=Novosphingobium flavum TaxID=1778672 RepID=A0A7X1KN85_9SPHN|nr:alpha/beta fold hydrolase [Novosphingobium flavum]MBC2667436.1 alpha/beta hydrolase [Novosphingobium flavum]